MEKEDWTLSEAELLHDYLQALKREKKCAKLLKECNATVAKGFEELNSVSKSRFYGFTSHAAEKLHRSRSEIPSLLYKYLEMQGAFGSSDPSQSTRSAFNVSAREFFRTKQPKFNQRDLSALEGSYVMYRRNWRVRNSVSFMTSHVRIFKAPDGESFAFRESQYWPADRANGIEEWREVDRGHLFPSGKTVIAICQSTKGSNAKFLSISKLEPISENYGSKIRSFSGTGIATSDYPPHVGYGFYCLRETEVHRLRKLRKTGRSVGKMKSVGDGSKFQSEALAAEDLNERSFDILREIFYNEGVKPEYFPKNGDS